MSRRRFTEREVLETLIRQGAIIPCKRCGTVILLSDIPKVEREHDHEVALGGPDTVANCFYSHGPCHDHVTSGTGATTAGTSIGRIAKTKRIERTGKMAVNKPVLASRPLCNHCGLEDGACICAHLGGPKRSWPTRRLVGRPFPPRGSRPMNKKRRA